MPKRQDTPTEARDRDRARRYRKVEIAMWNDEKFQALSSAQPNGQTLWQWLLTGPRTTILPGLVIARDEVIASDLGWPVDALRDVMREVIRHGLAQACPRTGLIVLTRGLLDSAGEPRDTARPASLNVVRGWARAWDEVPDCDLKDQYLQSLRVFCEALSDAFAQAFRDAFAHALRKASSKASRIQDSGTGSGIRSEESPARAHAIPSAQMGTTPRPAPTPQQPSLSQADRGSLRDRTWAKLNAERERIATARGWRDVRPLHPLDPGRTELAARILESGPNAEADVAHVLAVMVAEAETKGTVQWLVGGMFEQRRWSRALGMQIDDAKRAPSKPAEERVYRMPAVPDDPAAENAVRERLFAEKVAKQEIARKRAEAARAAEAAKATVLQPESEPS